MPKSLINAKLFNAARNMPSEAEDSFALTVGKFDKSRWPELEFPTLKVKGATAAVSPDCSYRFLKSAVDAAKTSLLIYIYDISAPYLIDLLAAAKKRGVKIRAMYDGTSGGEKELAALKKVGTVKAAPSSGDRNVFTVCHQKFLVIDNKFVVVESANWAKSSIPQSKAAGEFKKGNREWLIRFDDAKAADWFTALFNADFKIKKDSSAGLGREVEAPPPPDVAMLAAVTAPATVFDVEQIADAEATATPITSPDNYLAEVKKLLNSAAESIYLQQQYVLAGNGVKDLLKVMAKKRADKPSFDIRVISSATFPQNWEKTKATLEAVGLLDRLKAINAKSFTHCHNKGVIVDGKAVVVSSTNWSENSILRAREAGVLVRSKKIANYYEQAFLIDWEEGMSAEDAQAQLTILDGADAI